MRVTLFAGAALGAIAVSLGDAQAGGFQIQ